MMHTNNRLFRLAATCCLCIPLLQACGPLTVKDTQTGAWVPMQTAVLEIHRDIVIPGGRTGAFFQNGRQIWRINEFDSFCQLQITTLQEDTQTVHPDRFTVTRVGRRIEEVVEASPVMLAVLGSVAFALQANDSGDSGGPSRITQMFRFRLHSDRQPDVRNLACGGAFDDPASADEPTLQEIAAALGDYATLELR